MLIDCRENQRAPRRPLAPTYLAAVMVGVIGGCGGGGGGPVPEIALSGVAVDGYLAGTTIRCLDASGAELARTTTGTLAQGKPGQWSLSLSAGARCHTLEASGGEDVGLGDGTSPPVPVGAAVYRARVDHLTAADQTSGRLAVSPVTTLIAELQAGNPNTNQAAAKATVLEAFAIGGTVDPLRVDPIASNNTELFKAGNIAATTIREVTNGIASAVVAAGGSNPDVVAQSRMQQLALRQMVTEISASQTALSDAKLSETLKRITDGTISELAKLEDTLGRVAKDLPTALVSLTVSEFAARATRPIKAATTLDGVTNAAIPQNDPLLENKKRNLIATFFEPTFLKHADLAARSDQSASELLAALQSALRDSQAQFVSIRLPAVGDLSAIDLTVDSGLEDYLAIREDSIQILTTKGSPRAVSVDGLRDGLKLTGEGTLAGVAISFDQPEASRQIPRDGIRRVSLGFSLAGLEGSDLYLSALITNLGLMWGNSGLEIDLAGAKVALALGTTKGAPAETIERADPLELGGLISANASTLKMDLIAFIRAIKKGFVPEQLLEIVFGKGRFEVKAVLRDASSNITIVKKSNDGKISPISDVSAVIDDQNTIAGPGIRGLLIVEP